jgi:N-acyl homoserine lactone hydrolase
MLGNQVRHRSMLVGPAEVRRGFVVETGGRPVVIGGDMAVFFDELDEPRTEGQRLVRALDPEEVRLSHEHEPWQPRADQLA